MSLAVLLYIYKLSLAGGGAKVLLCAGLNGALQCSLFSFGPTQPTQAHIIIQSWRGCVCFWEPMLTQVCDASARAQPHFHTLRPTRLGPDAISLSLLALPSFSLSTRRGQPGNCPRNLCRRRLWCGACECAKFAHTPDPKDAFKRITLMKFEELYA